MPPCRVTSVISSADPLDHVRSEQTAWHPAIPLRMFCSDQRNLRYTVYTDGSTVPGSRRCGGYGVVVTADESRFVESGGHVHPSGANFLAELTAVLAALVSIPAQADVEIVMDCMGGLGAIARDDYSERSRIRAACRAVLTSIRRAAMTRDMFQASPSLRHVHSHLGENTAAARGNQRADARANRERIEAIDLPYVPFLQNEERYIAWIKGRTSTWHVTGDFRREMRRWAWTALVHRWAALRTAGRCAKSNPEGTLELCRLIRKRKCSRDLLFAVLGLCEHLPVGELRVRSRTAGPDVRPWMCPSCHSTNVETARHVLACPNVAHITSRASRRAELALLGSDPVRAIFASPFDRARRIERRISSLQHSTTDVPGYALATALSITELARAMVPWLRERELTSGHGGLDLLPRESLWALAACFRLSCQLFDPPRCGLVLPFWWSSNPRSSAAGSRGCPWRRTWEGMLALCTPLAQDLRNPLFLNKLIGKASEAVGGPRPTRVVLLCPADMSPPAPFVEVCGALPGARVAILENQAARITAPVRWLEQLTMGGCIYSASRDRLPGLPYMPPSLSWSICDTYLLPFWHESGHLLAPPWAAEHPSSPAARAWRSFVKHDRYAGMMGVPPPDLGLAISGILEGTSRPRAATISRVGSRLPEMMLRLFDGAREAWELARRCRQAYETQCPVIVSLDSERQILRHHERDRRERDEAYSQQLEARRLSRKRREWLHDLCRRGGFLNIAELLSARPSLRASAPPVLAGGSPRRRSSRCRTSRSYDDSFVEEDLKQRYFGEAGREERTRRARRARSFSRKHRVSLVASADCL